MHIRISAIICCALFSGTAVADPVPVKALTKACAECHGPSGVSGVANTPHLNGQTAEYLEEEISGLANKSRLTGVADHVPGWSGPEIAAIAKYYSRSRAVRPAQTVDADLAAKGEEIYKKRCAECHPENGRKSDHDAPLVAAQNVDYLKEQVRSFVDGKRKFVFKMDDAFRGLALADLDAISTFWAGQEQGKK